MDRCPNEGKLFGGCKFEGRFDSVPPEKINDIRTTVDGALRFVAAMTKKIYVHDICVRCGKIIKR
jgi:hypothetical protein